MTFTAKDVQALRDRTGCGMMACKNALVESDGDMEKAIAVLREKGLAAAAKKAGRIAAEGLVSAFSNEDMTTSVIIEVNSETDFVAKNDQFKELVKLCGDTVLEANPATVEELMATKASGSHMTIEEIFREKILTIGENMKVRRFQRVEGPCYTYVHGGGRIASLISYTADSNTEEVRAVVKEVALQAVAYPAQFLEKASVSEEVLENEKKVLLAQAMNEGKPEEIAAKMVNGRIQKFYKEACLLEQPFMDDEKITVREFVEKEAKKLGVSIRINSFFRYEKGEGLQKREDDFAAEVANLAK